MQYRKETLIEWLRDAHAMEKATIKNIERLVERLKDFPQIQERYRAHLLQSRQQLERVDQCLDRLGSESSMLKDAATRLLGVAQTYTTWPAEDEALKHCLAGFAFENFEIASYISLIAAAEALGETEIKRACEQSLEEERAMASWIENSLPGLTQQYLAAEAADRLTRGETRRDRLA